MQLTDPTPATIRDSPVGSGGAKLARRLEDLEGVVGQVEADLAEDHFSAGFGKFREAVNLSRGIPALEQKVVGLAVERAQQLLPRSWRIAESLLLEAAEIDSQHATPSELWDGIHRCAREQAINSALNAADFASSTGALPIAQHRLATLLAKYPGDVGLETRLKAVEGLLALQFNEAKVQQADKQARTAEAAQLFARSVRARAREFEKSGFYADALEQWEALRKIDPLYPQLGKEIARCRALKDGTKAEPRLDRVTRVAAKPERPPVATPRRGIGRTNRIPERSRNAITLIFTFAAVTAAGCLVWMHQTTGTVTRDLPPPKVAERPMAPMAQAHVAPPITLAVPPIGEGTPKETKTITAEPKNAASTNSQAGLRSNTALEALVAKPPAASANQSIEVPPPIVEQPPMDDSVSGTLALAHQDNPANPDKEAWSAVHQDDLQSVKNYLSRFPNGANRPLAEQALANIRTAEVAKRQSADVLEVLRKYSLAWSARDVDSILSLQRDLDKRAIKAQLSPLKSLVMNISPVSEPRIDGKRATVECRRQVSEVFADDVERESPQQLVTFILVERDGNWIIESAKE